MRKGPYPLSVHLGMATSSWPVFSQEKDYDLVREMKHGLDKMLRGIQLYQAHPYTPQQEPLPLVWEQGSVTIRKCEGKNKGTPLLLIPSLINRSSILDLCEDRSFARWIAAQNTNVYLLDWGNVAQDPAQKTIDGVVLQRLVPAIEEIAAQEGQPVSVLGYCMGGTLLMGAAMHAEEHINKIVLLAAPWDFHAGSQEFLKRVKFWAPSTQPFIGQGRDLPVEGIQTLFASLDPAMAARKFITFGEMDLDSPEARLFVAVEDWLNEGVALPAGVAAHCLEEWYMQNRPGGGTWEVGGKTVDLAALDIKTLIVTSKRDRLVEYECAAAPHKIMKNCEILSPECGHIGMIAGKNSIEILWQPLANWLSQS